MFTVNFLLPKYDYWYELPVLNNMRRMLDLNKLKCNVMGLTWGAWDASTFSLHPKFILGADVLYDASAFDDLFATVTFLLQSVCF
ncbi:hypothetical protein FF1_026856 [Malus domestica]